MFLFICIALLVTGWIIFSLTAGFIVYHSSQHKHLENNTAFESHIKDPRIMDPLNSAKERWKELRGNHTLIELSVLSKENFRLSGWLWPAENNGTGKTVILVHGVMDSAAGMGYLAEEYHKKNWDVLCIDLRAHGDSEGKKSTMGVLEADDLVLWVDLLVSVHKKTAIFLHGVSMGGAAVLMYGGNRSHLPDEVMGIVSDSSFASYFKAFSLLINFVVRNRFIAWSIAHGASLASYTSCGIPFAKMSPLSVVDSITVPLLFFHGENDVLVPIRTVQKMFDKAVQRTNEIVVIPEAPHIGAYFYAPLEYMDKIEQFSRRNT